MRTKKGIVTSNKMDKTIVVWVDTYKNDPKYKKKYRITKKFYANDEKNSSKEGDIVTIGETSPSSKTKRWTLIENV
jgi:small subunit ribosomal protein S17